MTEDYKDKKQTKVKVISNPKIASFLLNKGYRIINIKKHRDYYCEDARKICDKKSVFAFLIEDNFLEELDYAINNYDSLSWIDEENKSN